SSSSTCGSSRACRSPRSRASPAAASARARWCSCAPGGSCARRSRRRGCARVRDDRALALELDLALAGEDAGAEARELARLLVVATEPARFEVEEPEVERALARVRAPGARRAPVRVAVALAVALGA